MIVYPTTMVPPMIRTLPSGSSVAVWLERSVVMLPAGVNVPADCAIATGPWPATLNERIGRIKLPALILFAVRFTAASRTLCQV